MFLSRSRVLALVVLLAGSTQATFAQDLLQWKFAPGETVKYVVQQQMDVQTELAGNVSSSKFIQRIDMSWIIDESQSGDSIAMKQLIDRMQVKMQGGNGQVLQVDTKSDKPSDNPVIRAMTNTFQSMVAKPFQVKMLPTGQVTDVTIPQAMLDAIKKSSAGNPNAVDENALKEMMRQSSVTLPATPVQSGQTWNTTQKMNLPAGVVEMNPTMTYQGRDSDTGLGIIKVVPKLTIQPREGTPNKTTLDETEGEGVVRFDINNGRVHSMQLQMTMKMNIETPQQSFPQTIKHTTVMTLAE